MSQTGCIGRYHWAQFWKEEPELFVPDLVSLLRGFLVGKVALNASWDSRLMQPSEELLAEGWSLHGSGGALSPPITESLASAWPRSCCGFDEWYFFSGASPSNPIRPIANFLGLKLTNWQVYNQPWGVDLQAQLEEAQPELVIGESYSIYAISPHLDVIQRVLSAAVEP